jgi:myo-inositol 2-dehydrogenase / D-chiro-inositol 1-dehydrogenase
MAVHDLDLARFLVGEVEEVHAWGGVLFDEKFSKANDVDTAVTMLRFANGALGVVETARHSSPL